MEQTLKVLAETRFNLLGEAVDIVKHALGFLLNVLQGVYFNTGGAHRKQTLLVPTKVQNCFSSVEGTLQAFHLVIEFIEFMNNRIYF